MIRQLAKISIFLIFSWQATQAVEANTVVATIAVGVNPASLAITPDSKFAYVANSNNYGIPGGYTVSVIDLHTNLVVKTISDASFEEPYRIAINPAGTKAYVANSNGSTVTIIDIATNTVVGVINGFDGPSGMVITPDGSTGYVNNYGGPDGVGSGNGTTVRVVDLTTNTIIGAPIVVGLAPAALAISPDGAFVYVINYVDGNPGTGTLVTIRTSDNTVTNTVGGLSGPFGIAITPDGKRAYITNFGSNNFSPIGTTVSVIDLSAQEIIATVNLAIQPAGIAITPDGRYVYATNYNSLYAGSMFTKLTFGQGTVNIIDTQTNQVVPPTIAVGESPSSIVIAPNGQFAYVTTYTYNIVNVIALPTFNITVSARKKHNRFLTQTDRVNELTISASGTSQPVAYAIYRDAGLTRLIATIPARQSATIFIDHNVRRGVAYTYYIVGTNSVGTRSYPVVITV